MKSFNLRKTLPKTPGKKRNLWSAFSVIEKLKECRFTSQLKLVELKILVRMGYYEEKENRAVMLKVVKTSPKIINRTYSCFGCFS